MKAERIDTSVEDKKRAEDLKKITEKIIAEIDSKASGKKQSWIVQTFLYIMWHEGNNATKRIQMGGGPGRGLMQFEPNTLKDLLDQYIFGPTKGLIQNLADAAGVTKDEMGKALSAFRKHASPAKNEWPPAGAGDAAKVETWLSDDQQGFDSFGILLMRYQFRRYPEGTGDGQHAFPGYSSYDGNPQDDKFKGSASATDDVLSHAGHWSKHWKKKFENEADKIDKKKVFIDHAKSLDKNL